MMDCAQQHGSMTPPAAFNIFVETTRAYDFELVTETNIIATMPTVLKLSLSVS